MPSIDLVKTFQFEAAHRTAVGTDPARLHGHSYTLDLTVEGPLHPELGWVVDYADITRAFQPIYQKLDHQTLDHLEGLDTPTLPNLENWILDQAKPLLEGLKLVRLRITGESTFHPQIIPADDTVPLPDRVRFGFEAAHALPKLPPDHKCHTMHGHSFSAEIAAGLLETLTDDVAVLYEQLDHRCLNDIPGLENPTSEMISIWIWNTLSARRDDLRAVLVAETCTARCIYHGG